jgi:hypothetical protein
VTTILSFGSRNRANHSQPSSTHQAPPASTPSAFCGRFAEGSSNQSRYIFIHSRNWCPYASKTLILSPPLPPPPACNLGPRSLPAGQSAGEVELRIRKKERGLSLWARQGHEHAAVGGESGAVRRHHRLVRHAVGAGRALEGPDPPAIPYTEASAYCRVLLGRRGKKATFPMKVQTRRVARDVYIKNCLRHQVIVYHQRPRILPSGHGVNGMEVARRETEKTHLPIGAQTHQATRNVY